MIHKLNQVYTRLGVTEHGVGVIAVREIPKGTDPFGGTDLPGLEMTPVLPENLLGLDPNVMQMVEDFCVLEDGYYWIPKAGLNAINVGWYLNHSMTPNMTATKQGEYFIAARDIHVGEELTVDYSTYDESGSEKDFDNKGGC
jgi:hypothetical protein